ncbi:MAG: YdcH family protein [Nitrospinota bacterium]|nr:YdcH family protein [Nitrospinota bacterium]
MTAKSIDSIEASLLKENDEYRKLHQEHAHYEEALEKLDQKKFLTPEDDLEFKRLKKLKLAGKDRMEQIRAEAEAKA